jgi:hypothetical protein
MNYEQVLDLFRQRYTELAKDGSPHSMEADIYRKILTAFNQYGFNPEQTPLQRVTDVEGELSRLVGETTNAAARPLVQQALDDLAKTADLSPRF